MAPRHRPAPPRPAPPTAARWLVGVLAALTALAVLAVGGTVAAPQPGPTPARHASGVPTAGRQPAGEVATGLPARGRYTPDPQATGRLATGPHRSAPLPGPGVPPSTLALLADRRPAGTAGAPPAPRPAGLASVPRPRAPPVAA